MNKEELRKVWQDYSDKSKEFQLNPDKEHVDRILDGVLKKEKETGLKLCPCRIGDGTREKELELLCPCNFKTHSTWQEKGRCWCGLFLKRE
jgi:ferredoxin-thioredoxin reductase catalytic subunit